MMAPEKDALESLFETVTLQPIGTKDAVEVLRGRREQFEKHHGVAIADGLLAKAVELAERKIRARITPGTQDALVRGFVRNLK